MSKKPTFDWQDPLRLDEQLTDEERTVRDAARQYAQKKLLPRVRDAFREEKPEPKLIKEFGSVHEMDCRSENELYVGEITNWRVQKLTLRGK